MKKLILIFIALVVISFAQQPPYDPYAPYADAYGRTKPIVPEPSTYGAIFMSTSILWMAGRKYYINRKK